MKIGNWNPFYLRRRLAEAEAEKSALLDSVRITSAMEQTGVPAGRRVTDPARAYEWHVWSYACASRIAQSIAMLPIVATTPAGAEALPPPELADAPNHACTLFEHVELLVIDACMTGNTYELIAEDGLWRVNPSRMKVIPDRKKRVGGWEFDAGGGQKIMLPAENVIHRRLPNPNDEWYGLGPGSVALDDVKLDEAMGRYDRQFFTHGSRLGAILETDLELSRTKKAQLAREFSHQFGGVTNAFKTAVASHGMKIREVGESHRDIEFHAGREMIRDRVLAAYLVPPILVGVYDEANFANSQQQLRIFYQFTILPMARRIAAGWTRNVVLNPKKVRVSFDEKEVHDMLIDPAALASAVATLYQSQLFGRDHLRRKFFREAPMDATERADTFKPSAGSPFGPFSFPSFGGGSVNDPAKTPEPTQASASADMMRRAVREAAAAARAQRKAAASEDGQGARFRRLDGWDAKAWNDATLIAQDAGILRLRDRVLVPLFRGQLLTVLHAIAGATELRRDDSGAVALVKAGRTITIDELIDAVTSTNTDWADSLAPEIHDQLIAAGQRTFASLGLHPNAFDIRDPATLEWARDRSFQFAQDVNATTAETLRGTFERVLEEGSSVDRLAAEIRETFDTWTGADGSMDDTRAMRIARTETVAAQNAGVFVGFESSGVVDGKEWSTLGDGVVRDSHAALDGTIVGLDEVFPNGLRFPGDMEAGAPASEIVNCRCTIQPVALE